MRGSYRIFPASILFALIMLIPLSLNAQRINVGGNQGISDASSIVGNSDIKNKTPEVLAASQPGDSNHSLDQEKFRKSLEYFARVDKSKLNYVATLDLLNLLSSSKYESGPAHPGARVMLGIKRPYYRLGRDMRLAGAVDLKMNKSFAGFDNLATVILGYDFQKNHSERDIRMKMMILNVSFKMEIPFTISKN